MLKRYSSNRVDPYRSSIHVEKQSHISRQLTILCLRPIREQLEPLTRMRYYLHMLMPNRSPRVSTTVEDRNVLVPKPRQSFPQGPQVTLTQRPLLWLKINRVEHELRPHNAELIQDQFVPCAEHAHSEKWVGVCEGVGDFFLGGRHGFLG